MSYANYLKETNVLHVVLTDPDCRFIWRAHARQRMRERGIFAPDVMNALMIGHVVLEERKQDILWRVTGKDLDGRILEVVVSVDESEVVIVIVTAF